VIHFFRSKQENVVIRYFNINFPKNGITCTTNALKEERQHYRLSIMLIVGQVSSKEEASEITFIAKLFIVGQRARFLASNKNADHKEIEEETEKDKD
jgi:uncharacterized membrane protein